MNYLPRCIAIAFVVLLINRNEIKAQDTIHVQCFTYGSSQDSSIVFPSDTVRIQKILMNYKLRCPFTGPCGEWDYLTYTHLFQPSGSFDSVMHVLPGFSVNGISPDTFQFMTSPSYSYHPYFERSIVHNSTISFDSATIAGNSISMVHPLNASMAVSRTQYVWKANELAAAGLAAGNITGLRFNLQSAGSILKHLTIRVKHSTRDSITTSGYEQSGFTTVYDRNTIFSSTGWTSILFTDFFNWDGISNLVFDISYSNVNSGTSSVIAGSNSGFASGITTPGEDRSLFFEGTDHVQVPAQAFDDIDSAITISFWAYGNPAYQPQDQSVFEAVDSLGQRVLNCHLPWSDGKIYWDAGNSGTNSFDRLSKPAVAADYEGNWVHWTFVKNLVTARMKIYKNGVNFIQGINRLRSMSGIKNFKIGSFANGTYHYDGFIDDFVVFNSEVDMATIQEWMYKKIDSTHPFYSSLRLSYDFDIQSLTTASDSAPGHHDGSLSGVPVSTLHTPAGIFKNFVNTSERPDVIFEQGVYNSVVDSVLLVDSTVNAPVEIVYYDTTSYPPAPIYTQLAYPLYYNSYLYDSTGHATDSAFVTPDSTVYQTHTNFWDPPYEVLTRYEIGRYITPYGNGLSLGNGFTWIYDVSDYRTLLHDTVHLAAGNWQELLDLSFDLIKGIPPRDPISVENIYPGGDYVYGVLSNPIENHFPPKNVYIDSAAVNTRIKYRSTGHGEDANYCDEFCPKVQTIDVNGIQQFSQLVWKDDCALNPLYPQGGTWIYQRANWCPGDDVPTFDFELTPFVTPGDSALLNVNFEPYTMVIGTSGNSTPHCVVEAQLIKYGAPNFTLDAAMYDIQSPSNLQIYQRHNPICNNPLVTIQNTGSTNLASLDITYGQVGGTQTTFQWTGNLAFMEKNDVQLGNIQWGAPGNQFQVTVSNPNGGTDQYPVNNTMTSTYSIPPQLENSLIFELKTNNEAYQNAYTLKDDQGNVVLSKSGLGNNIVYNDTIFLPSGCYEFRLTDTGEDGLTWWANPPGGSGYLRIKRASNGSVVRNFNSDFGAEIYLQFTVGFLVGIENAGAATDVHVYPNPSTGKINLDLNFNKSENVVIEIYGITGNKIYTESTADIISTTITADLSMQPAGIYMVSVKTGEQVYHSRIVLTK